MKHCDCNDAAYASCGHALALSSDLSLSVLIREVVESTTKLHVAIFSQSLLDWDGHGLADLFTLSLAGRANVDFFLTVEFEP